jgi:hypothetical protein
MITSKLKDIDDLRIKNMEMNDAIPAIGRLTFAQDNI